MILQQPPSTTKIRHPDGCHLLELSLGAGGEGASEGPGLWTYGCGCWGLWLVFIVIVYKHSRNNWAVTGFLK